MEGYKIIESLGDGSYGCVTKAINQKTGETVAIKSMKEKFNSWQECLDLREVKSLRKLIHPNIIKLKEAQLIKNELFMVFEHLDQNLYQFYKKYKEKNQPIPEILICKIIHQIVSALAFMHKNGFFHRDLKPENILIQNDQHVKLIDFGLAREIRSRPPFTEYVSTRWYRAPEIILMSTNYNSPADIFALGCIMAELYMQGPLFAGASSLDQMIKVLKIMGTPTQQEWPEGYQLASKIRFSWPSHSAVPLNSIITNASQEAINFIQSTLIYDPNKRPTSNQLLQHPYFEKFLQTQNQKLDLPEIRLKSREGARMKLQSRENARIKNELARQKINEITPIMETKELNKKIYDSGLPTIDNKYNYQKPVVASYQQPYQQNYQDKNFDKQLNSNNLYQFDKQNNLANQHQNTGTHHSVYGQNNNIQNNYNYNKPQEVQSDIVRSNIYDFSRKKEDYNLKSPYINQVKKRLSPVLYNQPINNINNKNFQQRKDVVSPYLQPLKMESKYKGSEVIMNQRNYNIMQKYGVGNNNDQRENSGLKHAALQNLYKF